MKSNLSKIFQIFQTYLKKKCLKKLNLRLLNQKLHKDQSLDWEKVFFMQKKNQELNQLRKKLKKKKNQRKENKEGDKMFLYIIF